MLSPIGSEMAWALIASPLLSAAAYVLWRRFPISCFAAQTAAGVAVGVVGILI